MVKKPYKVANSRTTKNIPVTREIMNDHNAKKVKQLKALSKRRSRRSLNKQLVNYTDDVNKGKHNFYVPKKDKREKDLYERPNRPYHNTKRSMFNLGDSWPH